MTILDLDDERVTPKQFAKLMFRADLEIVTDYWSERWQNQWDEMTARERKLVQEQINKIADRIYRIVEP